MRRLTAYRERYEPTTVDATFGRLTIVEKYRVSSTSNNLVLAFRFVYNYTKYAVVLSKKGGDSLSASNLTAIGVATDEVVINVEMKKYKIWIATIWYLEQLIAPFVAGALGMTIISRSFSGTTTTTIMQADEATTPKQITSIANVSSTYLTSVLASTEIIAMPSVNTVQYDFFDLELDDKTAIGITYQGFNPEAPDQIGFKYSNSFNIPRTNKNDKLTGFGGVSDDVYDPWFVNYIVDNEKLIYNGKIKVTDISVDRISCTIAAKSTVWDKLKKDLWADFMAEFVSNISSPNGNDWSTFLNNLISHGTFTTKAFYGDLFGDSELELLTRVEDYKSNALNEIVFKILGYNSGQVCVYVEYLFQYIHIKYGIDLLSESTVFYGFNPYIQSRNINIYQIASPFSNIFMNYTRGYSNGSTDGVKLDKGKKTVYDFVKDFIIHTGCLVDIITDTKISLNRMDNLLDAPVLDFSGNIEKDSIKFIPTIDGISQNNYIDFNEYSNKIPKESLKINLPCYNYNIETASDFLKLNEFAPPAYLDRDRNVLGLFEDKSWDSFTFLQDSGYSASYNCLAYFDLSSEQSATKTLQIAKICDIGYTLWSYMIKYPKRYKFNKWLTSADLKNIKLFQRYWIDELQGYFMLLKINGLNPEKSNEPTEMEFVKIPNLNAASNFGVSPLTFNISPSENNYDINIYSALTWLLVNPVDWISLNKTTGNYNDTVIMSLDENTSSAIRSSTIESYCNGEQITITINQYPLKLIPSTLNYTAAGGIKSITIETVGDWTVEVSNAWIVTVGDSGSGNYDLNILVESSVESRSGTVTIINGTVSKIVSIIQTV